MSPTASAIMTLRRECNIHRSLLLIISLIVLIGSSRQQSQAGIHHQHQSNHKASTEIKASPPLVQILIPNLPPKHYQYWLKNHPSAAKIFEGICQQVGSTLTGLNDLSKFQGLHVNLSFEDPQYIHNLEYGKQVLGSICPKIKDVSKSCWGYENNCQDIYLMPECSQLDDAQMSKQEQERRIAFFSQADFGYVLERVREFSKYCAPDKKINPTEVSTLECSKYFTTCRGQNLYVQFNTSAMSNHRLSSKLVNFPSALSEVGGWGCDLQSARIGEEAGREGWLESWHGELKDYHRVDRLQPMKICDYVEEKQVFFIKIDSTNNLYDYLSSFINLYATIHLNNRFSEDNRIVIWSSHLPRDKTFGQLWYAFSRLPPVSIGQFDGKRVCFKKFIFVMPPKMVDGLSIDKPLVEGCSKSGLYDAFHKHLIHRLRIPNLYDFNFHRRYAGQLLRIVILSRSSETEFRNILNENQLEQALKNQSSNYFVKIIRYNSMDFGRVVLESLNSDIMIGIHGSGLAYSHFLPDWASLIELYDCGKERYHNLARLRGINYFKRKHEGGKSNLVVKVRVPEGSKHWPNLKQRRLLEHDEYSNYEVNLDVFMELFAEARDTTLKARDDYFRKQSAFEHVKRPETSANQYNTTRTTSTVAESTTSTPTPTPSSPTNTPKQQPHPLTTDPVSPDNIESNDQERNEL